MPLAKFMPIANIYPEERGFLHESMIPLCHSIVSNGKKLLFAFPCIIIIINIFRLYFMFTNNRYHCIALIMLTITITKHSPFGTQPNLNVISCIANSLHLIIQNPSECCLHKIAMVVFWTLGSIAYRKTMLVLANWTLSSWILPSCQSMNCKVVLRNPSSWWSPMQQV